MKIYNYKKKNQAEGIKKWNKTIKEIINREDQIKWILIRSDQLKSILLSFLKSEVLRKSLEQQLCQRDQKPAYIETNHTHEKNNSSFCPSEKFTVKGLL